MLFFTQKLERRDSNPRMTGPEPVALPLGYSPSIISKTCSILIHN